MTVKSKSKKPKTTRFVKEIVTEGKYRTFNSDGTKTLKEVTAADIDKAATTFDKMVSKGLKVPAPWKHDFNITTFSKIQEGEGGLLEDSTKNAGFWDKIYSTIDQETGLKKLVGEIEVPGTEEDPNTPAGKVGKSVKDVSIYMRPKYEMTDESGEVLENVLMHVALVTHPIEPGQKNFEVLPDPNDVYIAMSEYMDESMINDVEDTVSFDALSKLLSDVVGVYLPASTTVANLVQNLTIALEQMKMCSKDDDDNGKGPESTTFRTEPIVMSFTKEQLDVLTKQVNPVTGKNFTAEELLPKKEEKTSESAVLMSVMTNHMQDEKRKSLRTQINTLVETGRCPKEYADSTLYPQADNYQIKLDNGSVSPAPIEAVIMALQAQPAKKQATVMSQGEVVEGSFYDDGSQELSDEEADKVADDLLSYAMGRK